MTTLSLDELVVTHHRLRTVDNVREMVDFVKQGGLWIEKVLREFAEGRHTVRISPLIEVSVFEDGQRFIHDGHHRALTTQLAGRDHLYAEEYRLTPRHYREYLDVNFQAGWFTPYDPRTHCRKEELGPFKATVKSVLQTSGAEAATRMIRDSLPTYAEPRKFRTLKDLARHLGLAAWYPCRFSPAQAGG